MSTPTYKNLSALVELDESRRRENSQNGSTETRIYIGTYAVAAAAQKAYGTIGTGDLSGYLIKSSTVEPMRGLLGKLVDVWSAGGEDGNPSTNPLPSDQVSVSGTNQSPKTERNPRYLSLETIAGELERVETAIKGSAQGQRDAAYSALSATGQELVDKIRRGNESYYLASLSYSWVTHSYTLPTMYRGGWVEAPGGPLAGYFVGDIAWLRTSDDLQYSNGIWALTRTWLGADAWDADLYST